MTSELAKQIHAHISVYEESPKQYKLTSICLRIHHETKHFLLWNYFRSRLNVIPRKKQQTLKCQEIGKQCLQPGGLI